MSQTAQAVVQKVWNHCHTLRDDGVGYNDYVEQLTYLLFLKMADEMEKLPEFLKEELGQVGTKIPDQYSWATLVSKDGDELEVHYRHILESLAKEPGMLGTIFRKSQNKIQDPAKLKRLIGMIDTESWSDMDVDVKGEIYEGLLEKNAQDTKSGAGQYFTPRALIQAMVEVVNPQPGQTICDPACGTGGFLLASKDYLSKQKLDKGQKEALQKSTFKGWELVDNTARLCCMNMFLHGIGDIESPVTVEDSLARDPGDRFNLVITNPPFGKKSSITLENLQDGMHVLSLVGVDSLNNQSIYSYYFWVDTTPPDINISGNTFYGFSFNPSSPYFQYDFYVEVDDNITEVNNNSIFYKLNDGALESPSDNIFHIDGYSQESVTLTVQVIDQEGVSSSNSLTLSLLDEIGDYNVDITRFSINNYSETHSYPHTFSVKRNSRVVSSYGNQLGYVSYHRGDIYMSRDYEIILSRKYDGLHFMQDYIITYDQYDIDQGMLEVIVVPEYESYLINSFVRTKIDGSDLTLKYKSLLDFSETNVGVYATPVVYYHNAYSITHNRDSFGYIIEQPVISHHYLRNNTNTSLVTPPPKNTLLKTEMAKVVLQKAPEGWVLDGLKIRPLPNAKSGFATIRSFPENSTANYFEKDIYLSSCDSCPIGALSFCPVAPTLDSINVYIPLGYNQLGEDIGQLLIQEDELTETVFSPHSLQASLFTKDATVIYDENDNISMIQTPYQLFYIHVINQHKYELKIFNNAHINDDNLDELLTQAPLAKWTFENPVASTNLINEFLIKFVHDSKELKYHYKYFEETNEWILIKGNDLISSERLSSELTVNGNLLRIRSVENESGTILSLQHEELVVTSQGERVASKIINPNEENSIQNSYNYDLNPDSPSFLKVLSEKNINGQWKKYIYDHVGRLIKEISSIENEKSKEEYLNQVIKYDYTPIGDDNAVEDITTPRSVISFIKNKKTSIRSLEIIDGDQVECEYDANSNLVHKKITRFSKETGFVGKIKFQSINNTFKEFHYSKSGNNVIITTTIGYLESGNKIPSTNIIAEKNAYNQLISEDRYDLCS
jgi:hypothetical protein